MRRNVTLMVGALILTSACGGSRIAPRSARDVPKPPASAPANVPAPGQKEAGRRLDLRTLVPPFPASLRLPHGITAAAKWVTRLNGFGLAHETGVVDVDLGNKDGLRIAVFDKTKLQQALHLRRDKRFVLRLAREGKAGSWVVARDHSSQDHVFFDGQILGGKVGCRGNNWVPTKGVVTAADICLSARPLPGKMPHREGPDVAFRQLKDRRARKAAYFIAQAIVGNRADALLKWWSPRGVRMGGRRVSQQVAQRGMQRQPSVRLYLKIPCSAPKAPGEQGWPPDEEKLSQVQLVDKYGELVGGHECRWDAQLLGGDVVLYPTAEVSKMPVIVLGKQRGGGWRIVMIRLGQRDELPQYEP